MKRSGFTLIEMLVVMVIVSILMTILIPTIAKMICAGKEATAQKLVDEISLALTGYARDHYGANAPHEWPDCCMHQVYGDYLAANGPKCLPCFWLPPERVLGHPIGIVNPVDGATGVKYRNNQDPAVPDAVKKNVKTFDLWCSGCVTSDPFNDERINNWHR